MASTNIDVIIGAVTSGRPLRPDGVSQLLRSVKVEVKLMAFPGEARSTGLGIVVGVAEVEETKPAPWIPTATALRLGKVALVTKLFQIKDHQKLKSIRESRVRVNRAGRITAPCSIRRVCDWWRPSPDVDTYRYDLNSREFDRLVYYSALPFTRH